MCIAIDNNFSVDNIRVWGYSINRLLLVDNRIPPLKLCAPEISSLDYDMIIDNVSIVFCATRHHHHHNTHPYPVNHPISLCQSTQTNRGTVLIGEGQDEGQHLLIFSTRAVVTEFATLKKISLASLV